MMETAVDHDAHSVVGCPTCEAHRAREARQPRRCANCGLALRASDDGPIHPECVVPDITGPKYRGTTSDFLVAPPNARNVTPTRR